MVLPFGQVLKLAWIVDLQALIFKRSVDVAFHTKLGSGIRRKTPWKDVRLPPSSKSLFFRNPIPTAAWPPPGLFGSSTDRSPRLPGLNLEAFGCHRSDVNALADYGLRFQQDMRTGRGDPCSTDEKGGGLKGARVGERWVTALWGWK